MYMYLLYDLVTSVMICKIFKRFALFINHISQSYFRIKCSIAMSRVNLVLSLYQNI